MSAEQVLAALERGSMRARAAERSRAQRRTLAAYVSGKPLTASDADVPKSAFCSVATAPPAKPFARPSWNGWGLGIGNTRFQPAHAAGLTAEGVPRLALKWAFGFPGASSAGTQPVIVAGRVYVATAEGELYGLDAKSGCVYWTLEVEAAVRSAITLDERPDGMLVATSAIRAPASTRWMRRWARSSGKSRWTIIRTRRSRRRRSSTTAACTCRSPPAKSRRLAIRGTRAARSAAASSRSRQTTGKRLWKTYTVADKAKPTTNNSVGTQLYGPAGGAIWNTPTIDTKRNVLYVGTGNNFAPPATALSDSLLALDLEHGRVRWSRQITENDIWNGSCRATNREAAVCPDKDAPDFDFTGSSFLVDVGGGRQLIVVGNKSGVIFGFDPDAGGKIVWERRVAQGSSSGGVFWGSATDGVNIYAANADFIADSPGTSGGMNAVDLRTGRVVWSAPGRGARTGTHASRPRAPR
jgi:polyvinyl alcohol dehydrogenase (cytochrome)